MHAFFKFPSTPHLVWLGDNQPREDKVLSPTQAGAFLNGPIIVEEKVDGANIGISFSTAGELKIQNRGQYLDPCGYGQFKAIWSWARRIEDALFDVLSDSLILFGEWCYAQHSVHYADLPDWFLGFDVFDRKDGIFWVVQKRNELLKELGLVPVTEMARGIMTHDHLLGLLKTESTYGTKCIEGLYLRREFNGQLKQRAKIINATFTQEITEHWSRKVMTVNECRTLYGEIERRTTNG